MSEKKILMIALDDHSLAVEERERFESRVESLCRSYADLDGLRIKIKRIKDMSDRPCFFATMRVKTPRLILVVSAVEYSLLPLASKLVATAERQLESRSDLERFHSTTAEPSVEIQKTRPLGMLHCQV